jgi:hypothetical protein
MTVLKDIWPSMLLATATISVILFSELAPSDSGTVIAVLDSETDLREFVTETDSWLLAGSDIPGGYVLLSNEPNFPQRLRAAGAQRVLNSDYAPMCSLKNSTSQDL